MESQSVALAVVHPLPPPAVVQGSAASVHALSFFLPEHSDASLSGPSEIAMGDGECGDTNDCSTLGDAVMQTTFQDTAESMADGQHPYWKLGASTAALPAYAPPLPCPPVGTDGVALGMPWVPAQPQYGLGYALAAPPAAATIFAKSSAMHAPVPRFQHPVELSQIVRDVLAGRLPSLPLGLKLDVEAVARELQGR